MSKTDNNPVSKSSRHSDRILAVIAVITIIFAWIIGSYKTDRDLLPYLQKTIPEADHFTPLQGQCFAAWGDAAEEVFIGYIGIGTADGYGGTVKIAAAVDTSGNITALSIVEHKETLSFLKRVLRNELLKSLLNKTYDEPFTIGTDIDGVSGATVTSRALAIAAKRASREVAVNVLEFPSPQEPPRRIEFGWPEVILLALFVVGIMGRQNWFRHKKEVRWISMLLVYLY